ncbi:MAG: ATP-binding protein [Sulfuricellaceae bacterium]
MINSLYQRIFPQSPRKPFLSSIWIVPVAALLIVGVTLAWVSHDKYQQTHESEYRLLEAHALYAEVQVAGALRGVGRLLNKVAEERLMTQPLRNDREFAAMLAKRLRDRSTIGALFVTDSDGRVMSSSNPSLHGYDISQQAYFTAHLDAHLDSARQPELYLSRPDKSLLGVTAITLTMPIIDGARNFVGVVGGAIDFNFFIKALKPVHPADSASVSVIINRDGDLIYRRFDPEKFFGKNVAKVSQVFQEHIRAGMAVTRHIGPSAIDGKTRLFVTRRIEESGLSVILSRGQDEVLANWRRNQFIHGLIFLFTAAVMLFLARVAHRRQSLLRASTEALREAKEAAEQANAAKSHFLAAASHDLRQPLHALSLLVSVLKHRHGNESNMKVIKPIEASAQALKELLDTLLDISKLDAGVVVPQKQAVSVDALLARLESEFALQIDGKGLKFRIRRARKTVYTDPTLLMEILRNLMSNACHHTRQGGILLGCRVRRELLAIQVWDSGKGIPEEELENIFREYYQVGNPERDRHKGLGLGLSIVERVAKLLGHCIRVRSRLGRGTMFEISVPLVGVAPSLTKRLEDTAVAHALSNILVIDDDPVVLQGTTMSLEIQGYHPVAAQSAAEALLKIGDHAPDLIIADYRLRDGKTGIEAIGIIRSQLGKSVPAILVSGDTLPARLREANASGFQLLHKPVDPDELNRQIKRLLVKGIT